MKITLSWLKKYLETEANVLEICKALTNIGLEVENCEDQSFALSYFSVAKIIEAKNHENSSKLKICQVDVGQDKPLQIICGAANARSGIKVAYAPIGAIIPANNMLIKKAKIAGVESSGMLCSVSELCLDGDDSGIIEIPDQFEIGTKISEIYNKNDVIIEVNVTPNRGDCLGVYGIARDLAALGIGKLKPLSFVKKPAQFAFNFNVDVKASEECSVAAFRIIKNIKNCQSPEWLKEALLNVGINSISAIVDITNYVMISLNRPMHAYDLTKLEGSLSVRFANNSEKFISLKNEEYLLDEKMLVISDDKKIVGVAGIMGSNSASCELSTNSIMLESAYFDAISVSTTGRKLGILSDARYRFERAIDRSSCEIGIDFATQLILEICGGEVSETKIIGLQQPKVRIDFKSALIKKRTGVEVPPEQICKILSDLEFVVEKNKNESQILSIEVPWHRNDVRIEEDLVEEVIRIYGYDKIVPQAIEIVPEKFTINIFDKVRYSLINQGFVENINWSFCDKNIAKIFTDIRENLLLANPISNDLNYMRPNLLIGLLNSCKKNLARNSIDGAFFEIGRIFENIDDKSQRMMISGVRIGKNKEQNHYGDHRDSDIFDAKGDIYNIVEIFGLNAKSLQIVAEGAPKYYHPHRSGVVKLGKNIIGFFGEIHPKILNQIDFTANNINAFEIFIDNLPIPTNIIVKKSFAANDLQEIHRDFAFLLNKSSAIGNLIKIVENCDKQLIKQVEVFDIYSGKNIEEGKKSIALRVVIQPIAKTLTSEEIDMISQKIISAIAAEGGVLRS